MNKLAVFAVSLLLFFGAMLWYLAASDWNSFIKSQIEIHGSHLTGQTVSVDSVDLKLTEGFGGIYGLNVSNPPQYQQKQALSLGEISLDVDVKSVTSSPIVIEDITVSAAQSSVEFDKEGNNNIQDLLDTIESHTSQSADQQKKQAKKDKKPTTKVAINSITVEKLQLTLDLSKVNGEVIQVQLPDITLTDIGEKDGLPADQLGIEISKKLLESVKEAALKHYKNAASDALMNKIEEKAGELFDSFKNAFSDDEEKEGGQ